MPKTCRAAIRHLLDAPLKSSFCGAPLHESDVLRGSRAGVIRRWLIALIANGGAPLQAIIRVWHRRCRE
jgi:hypothetical protein